MQSGWIAFFAGAAVLAAAETAARGMQIAEPLIRRPVDIQSPELLCPKLRLSKEAGNGGYILLGDSLAYGGVLADHGDADWREHELSSALTAGLAFRQAGPAARVINIGLNGGLPADQEKMLSLLEGAQLDLIVITVSIRSFSSDFARTESAFSRPWLAKLTPSDLPACRLPAATDEYFDRQIATELRSVSTLYDLRHLVHAYLFSGNARAFVETAVKSSKLNPAGIQAGGANKPVSEATKALEAVARDMGMDLTTLMLAKSRFAKIGFGENHAQVVAAKRLIALSARLSKKVIFVYGNESPLLLPRLISNAKYQQHRASLRALFEAAPPNVAFVEDISVPAANYVDYAHVDAKGYQEMAKAILVAADKIKPLP